jgi:polar amino acid transport system substrate-binding protein
MITRGRAALLLGAALLVSACTSGGASPSAAPPGDASAGAAATPIPGGLLDKVLAGGKMVMSTDPQYPPQSELDPSGALGYKGFDIDVGAEIAKRLGVDIEFVTPDWNIITAGSWGGRWDFSVGSMTITAPREKVLAFSKPYYFTPAQMAASTASGITTLDGLAGKKICVGEATTYFDWLSGTLDLGTYTPTTKPPAGSEATTLSTDRLCAETWKAGRKDFDGWLTSSTTVEGALTDGLPLVKVGDPVFFEPLGVAFDKSGPDPTDMVARVDQILADMRADGTLPGFSAKWFGTDLTAGPGT